MKTTKVFIIAVALISTILLVSCSSEPENKTLANVTNVAKVKEPKIVVNKQLDSLFICMIDTAQKYFNEMGVSHIQWSNPSAYERDSMGNRVIHASYSVEGRMSGMNGNSIIKVEQAIVDTIIIQSIPYSDGSFKKSVNKLKKGEIIITVENFIFSHSKKKMRVLSDFIKILEEQVFAYDGEVWDIKAQMN